MKKTEEKPMLTETLETQTRILNKLAKSGFYPAEVSSDNPWQSYQVDKMELEKDEDEFHELVEACRFFYKKDPLISTTLNKMEEIAINELIFHKNGLTDNELKIFTGIKDQLMEFAEMMAHEYLISGLVIPEITYGPVNKDSLKELGIKNYTSLTLPVSMWIRDPLTVKIKDTAFGNEPSYFAKAPDSLVAFVLGNGAYPDGTEDPKLWAELKTYFPDFITQIKEGKREFLLDNNLIFRRKIGSDSPYPSLFVSPSLESLKHKRNLRRMDYSIAARAIGAIQLIKLGDKDFPVTEEDDDMFDWIRGQMFYRNSTNADIERIFQLFANHTLTIEWVYPPMEALLSEGKYKQVDADIIYGLGFPQILITGETSRSGTSSAQYAMLSPIKTMEAFRSKILKVIRRIVNRIAKDNHLKTEPIVNFKPLNLFDYSTLLTALGNMYKDGTLSRTTYAEELGYNFNDEMDLKEYENKIMKEKEIGEFAPQPFSPVPGTPGGNPAQTQKKPAKPVQK